MTHVSDIYYFLSDNDLQVVDWFDWFMAHSTNFSNISVISWRSGLLVVEETGVPGENLRHVASH
jgi:hypothetical protein